MSTAALPAPGFLSRERTIAGPGFSRWMVPPAALAIHLCIGMAYGFSVFWLPLSKAIGITESVACPADISFTFSGGHTPSSSCFSAQPPLSGAAGWSGPVRARQAS
jgi:hypothetical protein